MHKKITLIILTLFFSSFSFITLPKEKFEEKPMVIVTPSYNNKQWYKKNLDSIFKQNYSNYRVIYINDASTDNTGELVENYVKKLGQTHRTTIIHNKENKGAMANHYKAVYLCKDDEIILHLDGDDWFKHRDVLATVNKAYSENNIWLTYGQFERLRYNPQKKSIYTILGTCDNVSRGAITRNAYREIHWITSSLRTFYAGLFKHIKLKDFLHNGTFFDTTCDLALMYPMLEMSGGKFKYIKDILYVYNNISQLNDGKLRMLRQIHLTHVIRAKEKYTPLQIQGLPLRTIAHDTNTTADLLIFSEDNPACLYTLIESVYCYAQGIEHIYILKNPCHGNYRDIYEQIKKSFPRIKLIKIDTSNFKNTLESILALSHNRHIILAKDTILLKDFVDIHTCINLLEKTYAHGFYLSLGQNIQKNQNLATNQTIPVHTHLPIHTQDKIFFWQFKYGHQEWRTPQSLSLVLYRKQDILNLITPLEYTCTKELCNLWNYQDLDLNNIGLFFKNSKALELHANKSSILEKLRNNLKIDIKPFFLLQNSAITEKIETHFETLDVQNLDLNNISLGV